MDVATVTPSHWESDAAFADYLAGLEVGLVAENARAGVVTEAERKRAFSGSASIARGGFFNDIFSMVAESAKIEVEGAGGTSVGRVGFAVLKTAAGVFVSAIVLAAAVACGIIGVVGFAFYRLCKK